MIEHYSIIVARKPLSEKSVAENVLKWGTGGLNIDGSRIEGITEKELKHTPQKNNNDADIQFGNIGKKDFTTSMYKPEGRFPANIIFDVEAGKVLDEQSGISKSGKNKIRTSDGFNKNAYGLGIGVKEGDNNGEYGDEGGASRFFYQVKDEDETNNIKTNNMTIDLRLGDCLEVLKTIPDNSIDAVITDPPYGLEFMGKKWDYDVPSTEIWTECLRVLKPGGHLLSFAGSRTYHRMAVRIEDAGFEIRDQIMWVYGSGFPKSHNIGKAIQKQSGDVKVVGTKKGAGSTGKTYTSGNEDYIDGDKGVFRKEYDDIEITNDWEGWGTALKPAHEPIVMARKPLSEKSIAENVLKHGTGGINIDGSRIDNSDMEVPIKANEIQDDKPKHTSGAMTGTINKMNVYNSQGRFPANIIFDEEAGQLLDEQSGISKTTKRTNFKKNNTIWNHNEDDGNTMNGGYDDKGGASRFFYCPKASKKDRNEGLEHIEPKSSGKIGTTFAGNQTTSKIGANPDKPTQPQSNGHPTVKPTDLMRYLINLITPPNGTILDPFMGSGSTGKAAVRCGVNFIGIEKEQEYMDIARTRIEHEKNKPVQGKLL